MAQAQEPSIFGFQTGPNEAPIYAGEIFYDDDLQRLYLSGEIYEDGDENVGVLDNSDCLLMAYSLDSYTIVQEEIYGEPNSIDICTAISLSSNNHFIMVGNSEPNGMAKDFKIHGDGNGERSSKMDGLVAMLKKNSFKPLSNTHTGLIMETSNLNYHIPYPQDIVTDDEGNIWILALTSTDAIPNNDYKKANPFAEVYPDWLAGEAFKYGTSTFMSIYKYSYSETHKGGITTGSTGPAAHLNMDYYEEYRIDPDAENTDNKSVYIGGIIHKSHHYALVVAGSTRALGVGYGAAAGGDEDGYISIINKNNGKLVGAGNDKNFQHNTIRIGTPQDDIITSICDDPNDSHSFFVVGATEGRFPTALNKNEEGPQNSNFGLQAFVMKVDIRTLGEVWVRHFPAVRPETSPVLSESYTMDCIVGESDHIYISGNTESDSSMFDVTTKTNLQSKGGADVWVASVNKHGGDVSWIRQIGTKGDDRAAKHGSLDLSDNVLFLYGETNGSLYRERDATEDDPANHDVFVMAINPFTGEFEELVEEPTSPPTNKVTEAPKEKWEPRGMQLAGDLYPGAIAYDSESGHVIFTGGSYLEDGTKSMCFTSSWDLNSGNIVRVFQSGTPVTEEACNAVAWSPFRDRSYAAGFAEHINGEGMFDYMLRDSMKDKATAVFGTIVQNNRGGRPLGGALIQEDNVQYPVAIVTSPLEDSVYVLSASSGDNADNGNVRADMAHPDLTTGGHFRYGSSYYASVGKYNVTATPGKPSSPIEEVMQLQWYESFGVDTDVGLSVSGMVLAGAGGDTLVAVGSTQGSGSIFGQNSGSDFDGFIFKLDSSTGKKVGDISDERTATRVDSSNRMDDWVNGVCVDKVDHTSVYIVGGTRGKIRTLDDEQQLPDGYIHTFVAKIDLSFLTVQWVEHFTMTAAAGSNVAEASAFSCAVDSVDGALYVGGTILNGALMDNAKESEASGGDDIFVVRMATADGKTEWIRQVGTEADDRLAKTGGLDVDADGHPIVYGETKGAFYSKTSSGKNDIVAFTLNKKTGAYHPLGKGRPPVGPDGIIDVEDVEFVSPGEEVTEDPEDQINDELNVLAIQTGPDSKPSYAGGMVYDKWTNSIYMTGATYGAFSELELSEGHDTSQCFLGVLTLPSLDWRAQETFGSTGATEACSSLALTSHDRDPGIAIAGTTEANGFLTEGETDPNTQYTMLMDVMYVEDKFQVVGGQTVADDLVQFPVSIISDGDVVYVASMFSSDTKVTADFEDASEEYPNFTSGGIEKYGSHYSVAIDRYDVKRNETTSDPNVLQKSFDRKWRKPYQMIAMESVFLSGMIAIGNDLVMVGSTRSSPKGDDMDGIMAKVSMADGKLDGYGKNAEAIAYFEPGSGGEDWILNACADPEGTHEHFFIVGAVASKAEGVDAVNAFVSKIRLKDLKPTWTAELEVLHASGDRSQKAAAAALGCDFVSGADYLYVAGNVENGATLDFPTLTSAGRDDIFVAKIDSKSGATLWVNQIGSNGDDRLARGGGVKADENGNAVVFGDTNGDFYRENSERNKDLFVIVIDSESGAYKAPLVGDPFPEDTSAPKEFFDNLELEKNSYAFWIYVLLAIAIVILGFMWYCRRQRRKRAESQKTSIFAYLQKFDVEDIDLRKSPPGGWHGTYLNKLAYGINKSEAHQYGDGLSRYTDDVRSMSHSSVVSDSLFMDTASSPSLGYRDTSASYDDLPDKYKDGSDERPDMEFI